MSLISKRDAKLFGINRNEYNLTQFDLVNNTNAPVVFNLFDTNTLSNIPTQPAPTLPPSVVTANIVTGGVGANPIGIAINTTNNTYYVTNIGFITVINGNTNTIITTIVLPLGSQTVNISYNPTNNFVYAVDTILNNVIVIDCSTNNIVTTIPVGLNPYNISFNSLLNRMYVCNSLSNSVSVIDCTTNLVIGLPINVGLDPLGIAFDSADNRMYVSNSTSNDVSVINCITNLVISTIPQGTNPFNLAYNPTNNTMYVVNQGSNDVYVIDCTTNSLVGLPINVGATPYGVAYNSLLNLMYVTNFASSDISVIDCNTNLVVSTYPITNPFYIVYNLLDNTNLITSIITDSLSVLSPAIVTTIYIGGSDNYNEFVRDVMNNPMSVKDIMFYSNTPSNLNQVIYTTKKDANGIAAYEPQIPALSINVGQYQASIAKLDFGKKGFTLDTNSSLSNFTVAAKSEVKLILVQQQLEMSELLPKRESNVDLTKNEVEIVGGVTNFNDVVPLYKTSIGEYFKNVIVSTQNDAEYEDAESSEEPSEETEEESSENISGIDSNIIEQDIKSDIKNQKTLVVAVSLLLIAGTLYYIYKIKKTA